MDLQTDSAACWVTGLWCGVVHRLIRERLVRAAMPTGAPYTPLARKADASCIRRAMAANPYLYQVGKEALSLLDNP